MNIGKSYVTVVDIDEAGNLNTGTLADYDLAASDAATSEAVVNDSDVEAAEGEELGQSLDEITG